jgi:hypothetical protein
LVEVSEQATKGFETVKHAINRLVVPTLFFMAACLGGGTDEASVEQRGGIPPEVTTSAASYTTAQSIGVTWAGLPGNATDWVGIAPAGSESTTVIYWTYTQSMDAGSHTFGTLPVGQYVARAFAADSYEMLDESAAFDVTASTLGNVSTNQANYSFDSDIVVTWAGLPGTANDWVAIAPQGSSPTTVSRWVYTAGQVAGSFAFEAPGTGGTYVARAFVDNSYMIVGESSPFAVGLSVSTDKSSYTTSEPVIVSWEFLPGNQFDWIAIAPAGSPTTTVTTWVYTNGAATGMNTFGVLGAGAYVVRAFENNSYTLLDETDAFTVTGGGAATVGADAAMYAVGQDIVVTWSGLPGNANDWIAIAPDGSADTSVLLWVYTAGQAAGSTTFVGGLGSAGSYVVRAFENDSYTRLGESAAFTVQ